MEIEFQALKVLIAITYFRWSFLKIIQTSRQLLSFFLKCFIQISTPMEEYVSISYKIGKQMMKKQLLKFQGKRSITNLLNSTYECFSFTFRWSPTYDVSAILTSIQSLLSDPNPNSPANSMAAQLFKENRREYEKRVKACVEQSWCDD